MPAPLEPIWNAIREELRQEAPDLTFHVWLDPLEAAALEGGTLYVRAPEHIRTWVSERYLGLIRRAAGRRLEQLAGVEVVGPAWTLPAAAVAPGGRADAPERTGLNPRYTFEQFVIGAGNRFAHAAALAVAELPAQAYNPLFLHGPPGLGKTHLLHAIGNYVSRFGAPLTVRYTTVEEFTSEFVDAVRERRTGEFKGRFRGVDVLLVDDVQFLERKERTGEEFFHTFNAALQWGRQLVLTSDRAPERLPALEERLAERFRSGLVVELERPGLDVRRAILLKRAHLDGVEAPLEVLDEVAAAVSSSVRALEGALIRVVAYASLRGEELTPALVRRVLSKLGAAEGGTGSTLGEIVSAAAEEFSVPSAQILARGRAPDVARARQVAMFLARELTQHSLPEIGRGVGGRNHTTVLHAVKQVASAVEQDPELAASVEKLRHTLRRPG